MAISVIVGMHRHGGVAEHGLRPCRRHDDLSRAVREWIAQVPQVARFRLRDDLQVGEGGVQHRIPIHEPLPAVDQALLMQAHEHFEHCFGETLVHREASAAPIDRIAEPPHLARDRAAGFFLPLPDALDERCTAEFLAGLAERVQLALDDHLRRDARVVGAGLPQRAVAFHAMEARERIHERVLERVAHVQRARHVRRRNHDAIGRPVAGGRKPAAGFPGGVNAGFDVAGRVAFIHRRSRARTRDYTGPGRAAAVSWTAPSRGSERRSRRRSSWATRP